MAPRKKAEVVVTETTESRLQSLAVEIIGRVKVDPIEEDKANKIKALLPADAFQKTSDNIQKLFEMIRKERDGMKPVLRENKTTVEVLTEALNLPVAELQASYIKLPVAWDEKGEATHEDRINLPTLRRFAENTTHPYHEAAEKFMKAHKIKFAQRQKSGKGKAATILESTVKAKAPATANA